jgi:2-dehydro-3-deoxygluconokinase
MINMSKNNSSEKSRYDVVTIGETMLRFTPTGFTRLEQAAALELHVGGSESNTAVGLARLGKKVAWLSRLTDNHLGHQIANAIASHGVDTSHVVWTKQDRIGLYFLENGTPPRASQVIYDRMDSAYSRFPVDELPVDLFQTGISRWLHITGISLWLSPTSRALIARAVELAKQAQWKISFDVNHRTLLCSPSEAREFCQSYVETADLVFLPRRDAVQLWSLDTNATDEAVMNQMLTMRSGKPTVMTLGSRGAMAADASQSFMKAVVPVEPVGRLGGGDAFSAGFLNAWLDESDLERSLRWAIASARMKYSIPGDLPIFLRSEVEKLVDGDGAETLVR